MTKRTTVWAAQDGLLGLLTPLAWPEGVRPQLGTPASMERDTVWVSGEVDDWRSEYVVSGLAQKDEFYSLRVHCLATRLGGGFSELRERLDTLGRLVEDAIEGDYTLGGTVMQAVIGRQQVEEAMLDDGRRRQGLLTFFIDCQGFVAG